MNIMALKTRPTLDPTDPEALRRGLDGLKSTLPKLREAEAALAGARAERATAAQALRDAIAAMQPAPRHRRRGSGYPMDAELHTLDERIGKARLARDQARAPLAEALRRALKPSYGEAARLIREGR